MKKALYFILVIILTSCVGSRPRFDSSATANSATGSGYFYEESSNNHGIRTSESTGIIKDYEDQIINKIDILNHLRNESDCNETFVFFTDPHSFLPGTGYNVDYKKLEQQFDLLQTVYELTSSEFIMCGGDLLNNGDTKSEACFKLSLFNSMLKLRFANPYIIVGNHDTNYQGDTYISNGDFRSCMLDNETLNDILFDGNESYYLFKTNFSSYYCFNTGIDFTAYQIDSYQWEQLQWFANSLLLDDSPYKNIFIHIALRNSNTLLTPFVLELEKIINAFKHRISISVNGSEFDYSNSIGSVCFLQAGHSHSDINSFSCAELPIIVTTSFSSPEAVSRPTFDIVFADYTNNKVECLRIGDGEDRTFMFS